MASGLLGLVHPVVHLSQLTQGVGVVGIELQHSRQDRERFFMPGLLDEKQPQLIAGHDEIGHQLESPSIFRFGLFDVLHVVKELGNVEMGQGVLGVTVPGLPEKIQRLRNLLLPGVKETFL